METVALINERFCICETDGETLGNIIHTLSKDMDNKTACAYFDNYIKTVYLFKRLSDFIQS